MNKQIVSPSARLSFESPYEIIEFIARMINNSVAWESTSTRLDDAHKYVQQYCMEEGWGHNVWHTVLDDAIRLRKEMR